MLRKKLQCISPEREKVIILQQDLTQPGWGEGYMKCYANKFSEFWNLVPNKKFRNRRTLGYSAHFDFRSKRGKCERKPFCYKPNYFWRKQRP